MKNVENTPNLIEPGIRSILKKSLNKFHSFRNDNYNFYFNLITFIVVVGVICLFLYGRYKGNIKGDELIERNRLKKEYIISKLMLYSDMEVKTKESKGLITDLPVWENHQERKNFEKKITFD